MPRTGRYVPKGVPKGWCARPVPKSEGGLPSSAVDKRSIRTVYRNKQLAITYGCPKGDWQSGGKFRGKKQGKCGTGMRTIRIMKPKARVAKSKNRAKYKCVPGK